MINTARKYKKHHFEGVTTDEIKELTEFHLKYSRGKDRRTANEYDILMSFSHAIRDIGVDKFIATQRAYIDQDAKRVYYLSMEFLTGKFLKNNLYGLGIYDQGKEALEAFGVDIDRIVDLDVEAGLGNGGLGRLAACYLDSMATLGIPGYGYGLRYEHGIFQQDILDGWQNETPDHWLTLPFPWELERPEHTMPVLIYGHIEKRRSLDRGPGSSWVDWQMFEGVPFDVPIVGYQTNTVNFLRLWQAQASKGFRLDAFNQGDYERAVAEKNWAENVTKVLYPNDSTYAGKELRLVQEYFLVTCSIRDMLRRYKKNHSNLDRFHEKNCIQMNDTHPALSVAELIRVLLDDEHLPWAKAWEITSNTCAYTNHTLMPEALEKWPIDLLGKVLPRHLEIIYEINSRFLQRVELNFPGDVEKLRNVSLIEEGATKQVRMANLAMVGSHAVNGVSALHSELLKTHVMKDFSDIFPERFLNITNGITPRRFLRMCNPGLSELINEAIGDTWVRNLDELAKLEPLADDAEFRRRFRDVKLANKKFLAEYILENLGHVVHFDSLFDVQIKRLHMYKRQLLNILNIIHMYLKLKKDPSQDFVARTFIFGAKAAPSYHIAKVVIKLINNLSNIINQDPAVAGRIKVIFIPNYNVTKAQMIIPASEISEQISTAGLEASGTGNMKFALNGALTLGTWDGANIEIAQHVGEDNVVIFGNRVEDISRLANEGYNPWDYYNGDEELREVLECLRDDTFCMEGESGLFVQLFDELTRNGDSFYYLADFRSYLEAQMKVSEMYRDQEDWTRRSILNVARMGWFSSDRSIMEYAEKIWNVKQLDIPLDWHK
ncbi:MAG: glycogen/starch/alpha-glucan phosphorylase [Spartobacteria bacterium]|nr:glycogen/starch/alpha-glucan phosphorylase [Spartobacteria bacterium]